jgi:hypothetical protein
MPVGTGDTDALTICANDGTSTNPGGEPIGVFVLTITPGGGGGTPQA